jgi:SAM-dependent methyltransferase
MNKVSEYYKQSVELGKKFQKENSSWAGTDCKNYHNYIRALMDKYDAKTVLDYGCGKGNQYVDVLPYILPDKKQLTEPMTFKTRINAESVYQFDPCVEEFEIEPVGQTFDAVICTQVLGSIPDVDMPWLKDKLMNYATKFVFIGLRNPGRPPKSKKRMYDPNHVTYIRTVEWYQEQFKDWSGPDLYWWFRNTDHPINDWYSIELGGLTDENRI